MKTNHYLTLSAIAALLAACSGGGQDGSGRADADTVGAPTTTTIDAREAEEAPEIGVTPELSVADFEKPLSWSSTTSARVLSLDSECHVFGQTSLAVRADTKVSWTSRSLQRIPGIAPERNRVEVLVRVPEAGAEGSRLSLSMEVPSIGVQATLLGTVALDRFKAGRFRSAWFRIPAALATALQGATYSDLKLTFTLDPGVRGTYHFDGLAIGGLNQRHHQALASAPDVDEAPIARPIEEPGDAIPSTFRRPGSSKFPSKPLGPSQVILEP